MCPRQSRRAGQPEPGAGRVRVSVPASAQASDIRSQAQPVKSNRSWIAERFMPGMGTSYAGDACVSTHRFCPVTVLTPCSRNNLSLRNTAEPSVGMVLVKGGPSMPHAVCAHCGVRIVHHETMVERDGKTYCCANCAAAQEMTETMT